MTLLKCFNFVSFMLNLLKNGSEKKDEYCWSNSGTLVFFLLTMSRVQMFKFGNLQLKWRRKYLASQFTHKVQVLHSTPVLPGVFFSEQSCHFQFTLNWRNIEVFFHSQNVKTGVSLLRDLVMRHISLSSSSDLKMIILAFTCYLHSPRLLQLHKCGRCSCIWRAAHFPVQLEFQWVTSDFNDMLESCCEENKSMLKVQNGPVSQSRFNQTEDRI